MNFELGNKRCLITGASQGIGAAIAERFLLENADVMIVSRGSENCLQIKDCYSRSMVKIKSSQQAVIVPIKHRWTRLRKRFYSVGEE